MLSEVDKLLELFLIFLKIGVTGFGGGYALIPLIEKEVVYKKEWLTLEELHEGIAFANIMPGPFSPQIVALCGYRVRGIRGSIVALSAVLLPSCIAIVAFMSAYNLYKDQRWMIGITQAIKPVVVILILSVVLKMLKKTFPKNKKELCSFDGLAVFVLAILAIISLIIDIHPVIVIIFAVIFGSIFFKANDFDEAENVVGNDLKDSSKGNLSSKAGGSSE